jgi:hypothetical protein
MTDNWLELANDANEYKQMIIDVLKEDENELAQEVYSLLLLPDTNDKESELNKDELDMKLRFLSGTVPYNMLIPMLREHLKLTITTDEECISTLNSFKPHLDSAEQNLIDKIVNFINGDDLDDEIIPEMDLIGMLANLPIEKYSSLLNCIDYIAETTEIVD